MPGHDSPHLYRNDVILDMDCHGGPSPYSSHTSLLTASTSSNHTGSSASSSGSSVGSNSSSSGSSSCSSGKSSGSTKLISRLSCTYGWLRLRHSRVCSRSTALPLLALVLFASAYWYGSGYMKRALFWIETQNPWLTFGVFMCFFTIVSFPLVVGYLILIITSGYLFGCVKGLLTVVVGANVGVAIAHHSIRALQTRLPIQR